MSTTSKVPLFTQFHLNASLPATRAVQTRDQQGRERGSVNEEGLIRNACRSTAPHPSHPFSCSAKRYPSSPHNGLTFLAASCSSANEQVAVRICRAGSTPAVAAAVAASGVVVVGSRGHENRIRAESLCGKY